jgi:uncharacterized protein YjiS (DUF1127 family)
MAYLSITRVAAPHLGLFLAQAASKVRLMLERRAVYTQTLRELESLSERELADLGIHSAQIVDIARDAANRL